MEFPFRRGPSWNFLRERGTIFNGSNYVLRISSQASAALRVQIWTNHTFVDESKGLGSIR